MINFRDTEERNNTLKTFIIGGSFIMCLWVGVPYLIRTFLDPIFGRLYFSFFRWIGGFLSGIGYVLAVWCVMLFIKEGRGTPLPFAHPKNLVMAGPYKFVRNPMVIGTVLFLLGSAILFESYGLLAYAVVIFWIMRLFVLIEEKSLINRFGNAYVSYVKNTPRWLPKFS